VVHVDDLVKDLRPPKAAALRAVLDKVINTNRNAVQAIKAAFSARFKRMIPAGANNGQMRKNTPAVTPGF
jgi:hypothetical protein